MRQSTVLGMSSSSINYCRIEAELKSAIKSAGDLPLLSFIFLGAPRISKARTGRVDLSVSTDLTAKCNGVNPSMSLSSKTYTHARMKTSATSLLL